MSKLLVGIALFLCACAADIELNWTKPGTVRGQLETDAFTCRQWSDWGTNGKVNPQEFESCMIAMGWRHPSLPPQGAIASR